jgi:SagB-type dehydrogenase family enzyme
MASGVGETFQRETMYIRGKMGGSGLGWANKPDAYKEYPDAPMIRLNSPRLKGGASLWAALKQRHSVRAYRSRSIDKSALSQLLWAAQGITHKANNHSLRTAPSAGGLYPIETYLIVHDVTDIEPGLYHYAVREHALEQLHRGDLSVQAARAALDQRIAHDANVVFVWAAVFARSRWKYKQRSFRYICLDAGHIAQNVALAAVAIGLGSCQIAALYDDKANELLGIDSESESVIYMTAVGQESGGASS